MKRVLYATAMLLILAGTGRALDSCRVFVWDNDAGEARQETPAATMSKANVSYYVWSDQRTGISQAFGQIVDDFGKAQGKNFAIYSTTNSDQRYPAVACSSGGNFAVAWQESTLASGNRWHVYARLFYADGSPIGSGRITVDTNLAYNATNPKIARNRRTGKFVVAWQESRGGNDWNIWARLYSRTGSALGMPLKVSDDPSLVYEQIEPVVAFNDTAILFIWTDNRSASSHDIYYRRYDTTLATSAPASAKLNTDVSVEAHRRPAVAASDSGYFIAAWHDTRWSTMGDIYAQLFGKNGALSGGNFMINTDTASYVNDYPSVAMDRSKAFLTAWQVNMGASNRWEVRRRYFDRRGISPLPAMRLFNDWSDSFQVRPAACYYWDRLSCAWTDFRRPLSRGDIYGQVCQVNYGATYDTLAKVGANYRVDNCRAQGRKVYYKYPQYDNPATSGWDEDPHPAAAPDSVLLPLDSAFVVPLLARNVYPLAFVRVHDTDSLASSRDTQKLKINSGTYDVCVVDLGYAKDSMSAGTIVKEEQDTLAAFSTGGGALLCSGNDFGEYYNGTSLFNMFGAVYDGPGNPAATGNIDSLVGMADAFTSGMSFDYPYQLEQDNSVDIIHAGSYGDTIFMSGGPAKWIYCRATSYSRSYKAPVWHKNVYLPFAMGALTSSGQHPSTATELTRRILAFQNFNVEPEPITDLSVDTTTDATEGAITLHWTAVSDDTLSEKATRYQLKVREYNASLPEYGKFTTEEEFYDSGQTYYQTWTPGAVGASEQQTVYLAPGKSYIFALKAGDESTPIRWGTLGAEPMTQSRGDTLTYHAVRIGSASGLMNQFAASELLDSDGGDTLYFTWNASYLFFGFARCDWRTDGDLFIYLDTKTGGADSTIDDWNGAAADTAALFDTGGSFKPDFCLAFDSLGTKCKLLYWTGSNWADSIATYGTANYCLDTLNNTLLTTIRINRAKIGSPASLKFLALNLYETSERCFSSFPPANPTGSKGAKAIARYPYYYNVPSLTAGLSPRNAAAPLAVGLSDFTAMAGNHAVTLSWATASENDNYQWLVERSTQRDDGYLPIATIPAQGGAAGHSYQYVDQDVQPGATYFYLLGDQDHHGAVTWHGPVTLTLAAARIVKLSLSPCQPNPARDRVTIGYAVPAPARVTLRIYDICGRLVSTLYDGDHAMGVYTADWLGLDGQGRSVPAGVYFYRLSAGHNAMIRKFTWLK